jgi:hypothetical protein
MGMTFFQVVTKMCQKCDLSEFLLLLGLLDAYGLGGMNLFVAGQWHILILLYKKHKWLRKISS